MTKSEAVKKSPAIQGLKRHKKTKVTSSPSFTHAAAKRSVRRAGILRCGSAMTAVTNEILTEYIAQVCKSASAHTRIAGRKTLQTRDVRAAMKKLGYPDILGATDTYKHKKFIGTSSSTTTATATTTTKEDGNDE
jgi:histone H3/H4